MAFFEKNKDKIWSKYTLKRTKLHRFKKFTRGSMPPNPPNNAHGFAMRNMSLRDMQITKSGKKISWPSPSQILGTPLIVCTVIHYLIFLYKKRNILQVFFYKILAKYSPKRTKIAPF